MSNIIHNSNMLVKKLLLTFCIVAFLSSCGTSLENLKTNVKNPDSGNGIVVGSIFLEPVPEWTDHDENYWLSIWREPVPRSEYTIALKPNIEEEIILQLPAGIYEISAIYEGTENIMSRGYGRKGALGLWFEIEEGEVQYLGHLKLNISPDNAYLRRQKDEAVDRATRSISRAFFGIGNEIGGKASRPVMYTAVDVEDDFQAMEEMLKIEGWNKPEIGRMKMSFITTSSPE